MLRVWLARLWIGMVTAWNLQAAFAFMLFPQRFAAAYELSGAAGEAATRGVGVLFLMWNIPYLFALKDPRRYELALRMAALAQATGLLGESYILSTLGAEHEILRASIGRFIAFDGAGLVLLLAAFWLARSGDAV